MEIVRDENKKINGETTVALGNFDGIHLGHRALIDTAINLGRKSKTIPSIFTFDCNFNEIKLGSKDTSLISEKQKERILKDSGIELLYTVKFCDEIKNMSPEEFVHEILLEKLNAKMIIVGFNFRFGHNALGDVETLKLLSKKYDFEVVVIPPIIRNDELVSSTRIRKLIAAGEMTIANELLDRNYSMMGKVISGKGRGKKLGFATANLKCDANYVSPKHGVYKTIANYKNKKYNSITNIGVNPTFSDVKFSIETHIIDFNQDIYGEELEIEFLDFIRSERKFSTIKDLIEQVNSDISEVNIQFK